MEKHGPGVVSDCFYVEAFPEKNKSHNGEPPRVVACSGSLLSFFGVSVPDDGVPDGDGEFAEIFSGQRPVANAMPFNTVYGCHCGTQWFGQLGDGRAATILEVLEPITSTHHEFQLKGCGRSLFSRGFDGRATLRGSIREMIGSEALHHLNVRSQRVFSVISTGDYINRPWYSHNVISERRFPPNKMIKEKEAVLTRVAFKSSFLRFGHIELAWRRGETDSIKKMVRFSVETTKEFEVSTKKSTPRGEFRLLTIESSLIFSSLLGRHLFSICGASRTTTSS